MSAIVTVAFLKQKNMVSSMMFQSFIFETETQRQQKNNNSDKLRKCRKMTEAGEGVKEGEGFFFFVVEITVCSAALYLPSCCVWEIRILF